MNRSPPQSTEAANKVKSSGGGGFPIRKSTMPQKMSNVAGLKGLNQRAPSSMLQDRGGGFRRPILNRSAEPFIIFCNFEPAFSSCHG